MTDAATRPSPGSTPLALDHVVIVVEDLDDAAGRLEGLGFIVTARSDHPFGTSNRNVMLAGTYLELVTVTDPARVPETGFARFIQDGLEAGRVGPRLMAFRSEDAAADFARLAGLGLTVSEPLRFGRDAVLADGSTVPVEFVVVLPEFGEVPVGSFACQHLTPASVWHESLLQHDNGAGRLVEVNLDSDSQDLWQLMSKVANTTGPPMAVRTATVDSGPSTIVVSGDTAGTAVIGGTTVTVKTV